MKTSILILGIVLVFFTNVCNAKSITNESIGPFSKNVFADDNDGLFSTDEANTDKPFMNEDTEVFNPETVILYNGKTVEETIAEGDKIIESTASDDFEFMVYEESMKEIIAQADLIIENSVSNEAYPLFNERTIEDEITALEMIIESNESNETRPLDFKKINSNSVLVNSFNSKRFIGMN